MEDYENSEKKEGAVNENIELTEDPIINQGILYMYEMSISCSYKKRAIRDLNHQFHISHK